MLQPSMRCVNSGAIISDAQAKVSLVVALLLVLLAFVNLRISAALATAYLVAYAVNRLRKDRRRRESVQ